MAKRRPRNLYDVDPFDPRFNGRGWTPMESEAAAQPVQRVGLMQRWQLRRTWWGRGLALIVTGVMGWAATMAALTIAILAFIWVRYGLFG